MLCLLLEQLLRPLVMKLGHDLYDTLKKINLECMLERSCSCRRNRNSFEGPPVLHWDGKMLLDIYGPKSSVDQCAIIVTRNGQETLLGIPSR